MEGARAPSLVSLCMEAAKQDLLRGDDLLRDVYELPPYLFDELLMRSPPLVLHKLHTGMPKWKWDDHDVFSPSSENARKRRCGNFDRAWMALFKLRWPDAFELLHPADWQQAYWEKHLQNCLDEAAEKAMLPRFDGRISEILISDSTLNYIGYASTFDYSRLHHHFRQFGYYLRSLRLQNALCVKETCDLLRKSRLESLILRWIRLQEHVDALCDLLIWNSETLTSIEFIHCNLSSRSVDAICGSLYSKGRQCHGIQHFSVHGSSFLDSNRVTLPYSLSSFLSSGRSLCSLRFCDNRLDWNFARQVFSTLLNGSSDLSILDLSENNIRGWLSNFNGKFLGGPLPSLVDGKSLQSLRVLNLRGNNLQKEDMDNLRNALSHMPSLEMLDVSDNPIEDDGVRSLISFFIEASEERCPLIELNLENCDLSRTGVTELFSTISSMKRPLRSLSIGDNNLGSQVAASLLGFIGSQILVLSIGGIGLDSSGFQELQKVSSSDIKLTKIDISKNRGGIEAAKFLSRLIERAPELVTVDASHNFIPAESLTILSSSLKFAKAKLEHLDLRGNNWDSLPTGASELFNLKHNGKPVVLFSSSAAPNFPYDDDP
ncbi:uncharacterized protein LOC116214214 isoform X2 [Punica granatum]|uniref:Uncharacterized protein LOC116214214 isoform X2 n=1 Tax=Punica granatum TaxID=22663 RepID=A0A6P8E645_PUNGR|nr:uncharacterized protein LOC116214214 isoform X2 [Punica granatum]